MAPAGWTDPKMPAHDIAQANREKFGPVAMTRSNVQQDPISDEQGQSARRVAFPGGSRKNVVISMQAVGDGALGGRSHLMRYQ
jgi:hypothetical protein